jgi:hypothetical protein
MGEGELSLWAIDMGVQNMRKMRMDNDEQSISAKALRITILHGFKPHPRHLYVENCGVAPAREKVNLSIGCEHH